MAAVDEQNEQKSQRAVNAGATADSLVAKSAIAGSLSGNTGENNGTYDSKLKGSNTDIATQDVVITRAEKPKLVTQQPSNENLKKRIESSDEDEDATYEELDENDLKTHSSGGAALIVDQKASIPDEVDEEDYEDD